MTATHVTGADWRCHVGLHHDIRRLDDNPEVHGQTYLECTRCGRHEDGRPVGQALGPRAAAIAFAGTG